MRFCTEEIQNQLLNGGTICRKYNRNSMIGYRAIHLKNNILSFVDGHMEKYTLSADDLTADDWEIVDSYYENIIANKILCFFWCPDDKTSFMVTMFERDGETVKKKGILAMKDIVNLHFQSRYLMMDKSFLQSSIEDIKKLLD